MHLVDDRPDLASSSHLGSQHPLPFEFATLLSPADEFVECQTESVESADVRIADVECPSVGRIARQETTNSWIQSRPSFRTVYARLVLTDRETSPEGYVQVEFA